jgi:hypothetical protein
LNQRIKTSGMGCLVASHTAPDFNGITIVLARNPIYRS